MTYIIAEPCVGVKDKACVEICPVDCIYDKESWKTLFIHPEECIDCGLCVDACPVEAIFPGDEVPREMARLDRQELRRLRSRSSLIALFPVFQRCRNETGALAGFQI